jgi:hypothetical protein
LGRETVLVAPLNTVRHVVGVATEMKHNTESHIGFRVDTVAMRVKHQGTLDIAAWVSERACGLYRSEQRVRI